LSFDFVHGPPTRQALDGNADTISESVAGREITNDILERLMSYRRGVIHYGYIYAQLLDWDLALAHEGITE
jgi:hypothetical protein